VPVIFYKKELSNGFSPIRNKKAEVPVVILVLGVLLLCVIIFVNASFFKQKEEKHGNIEEIVNMESCLSYIEQYTFYKNNQGITGYSVGDVQNLPIFKKGEQNLIVDGKLICDSEGIKIKYSLN